MLKPFEDLTYLGQVRRLRNLARSALRLYPITPKSIKFIHHGENATFCVTDTHGSKFLLRIHRNDYHSVAAINEELKWLNHLTKEKSFCSPKPVFSKNRRLLETVADPGFSETRNCSVFIWVEGHFFKKSVRPTDLFKLGRLLGRLQNHAPKKVQFRKYWTAEGLVGTVCKFGAIDKLQGIRAKDQKILSAARRLAFRKLSAYEKRYPERQGMIHADLHFGNLLKVRGELGAIDFDDCGFGFHAYDLTVPLISLEHILDKNKIKLISIYRNALLKGYWQERKRNPEDLAILPILMIARRLTMLAWLNSRSDNPRLRKYLVKAVQHAIKHIKQDGHRPFKYHDDGAEDFAP